MKTTTIRTINRAAVAFAAALFAATVAAPLFGVPVTRDLLGADLCAVAAILLSGYALGDAD